MREKLIGLKNVQITFESGHRKFVAVDDVNFDIYKGETFSLVGESGSGTRPCMITVLTSPSGRSCAPGISCGAMRELEEYMRQDEKDLETV